MDRRSLIIAVLGVLVVTVAVRADMTPMSGLDAVSWQSARVCDQTDLRQTNSSSPFAGLSVTDVNWRPFEFPPETSADPGQIFDAQHPHSLTSGPSSLNLCLSALIGLGLCSSAGYVKKLHFGIIPQWYHNGGPFQIGHSLAVSPESLYPALVDCFIQPDHAVERLIPQYRPGAIVSLWRKSQFTPDVIASRGPPPS